MAITFNISAQDQTRVVNAIASEEGWQANIIVDEVSVPNPESKAQFALRILRQILKSYVKKYETKQALVAASATFDTTYADPTIT